MQHHIIHHFKIHMCSMHIEHKLMVNHIDKMTFIVSISVINLGRDDDA